VVTAVDLGTNESGYSSEDNATPVGITHLDDDFEGTPFDANWDSNGTTTWQLDNNIFHSGLNSVKVKNKTAGSLTSDDLDATSAFDNILVEFWFYPKEVVSGDVIVEIYNGSAYNTW